jgi:hypothetical protein
MAHLQTAKCPGGHRFLYKNVQQEKDEIYTINLVSRNQPAVTDSFSKPANMSSQLSQSVIPLKRLNHFTRVEVVI